jgi:hypothetical protein
MNPRWRLTLAVAAFLGWMGYLGYAAVTKSRAPVVSHIQSAAADAAVVAELSDGPTATVAVVEKLWGDAPAGTIEVVNLANARGFAGPGKYLLYLGHFRDGWAVVGGQRSPGDMVDGSVVLIYPWTDDVQKQAKKLKPKD